MATVELRALLRDTLRTEPDFNTFCLDYFPDVHRKFTGSMDGLAKENFLLQSVSEPILHAKLAEERARLDVYKRQSRYRAHSSVAADSTS